MSLSAMQRYVLSPDEFAWLATIKETVFSWDEAYDEFIAKFPKCPVDRKKLERAYRYYKKKFQLATTSSSEKPKPKTEGGSKRETQTGNIPRKRKADEEKNHAKGEGARRYSPRLEKLAAQETVSGQSDNSPTQMAADETGLGTESHTKASSFLTRNMHTASEESIALLAENSLLSRTIRALVVESDEAILRLTAEVARTKKLEEELKVSTSLYTELFNDHQLAIERAVATYKNEHLSERAIEQMEKDEQGRNNDPITTRIQRDRRLGTSEAQRNKTAKAPPTTEKTKKKQKSKDAQTEDKVSSEDDFSSDSDNDKVKETTSAAAKAKAAKAKETLSAAAKAKATKAKETDNAAAEAKAAKAKKTDNAAAEAKAAKAKETPGATAKAKAAKDKKTDNAAAEAKAAKAKKTDNAAVEAKAPKAKADSEKPNPLSTIRPSTSGKQGGVSVFNKPRVVTNVTK